MKRTKETMGKRGMKGTKTNNMWRKKYSKYLQKQLMALFSILPKSESPQSPDSADNFEFSAERLSENAKSIKIMLFAELLTVISPSYVQSLQ